MAQPTSILQSASGFARDHAIDQMPRGFVWDMADYIPNRRGAKLEGRGPWSYFSPAELGGRIWGGKHAAYSAGQKLLVGAGGQLYDVDMVTGTATAVGAVPVAKQNGVLLRNRVYFADGSGTETPKVVTWDGSSSPAVAALAGTNCPKPTLIGAYKDRLIASGDPANPANVYFSPLEVDSGPLGNWDVKSFIGTTRSVTAIYPMTSQIIVFHDGSIEKIRGGVPPASLVDTDMYVDVFSEQIGTSDPASVVPWQENVCFANPHGVYLTDGATLRSLTDQGGIGDLWRNLYAQRATGTQVHATVFLDNLMVTVLTNWNAATSDEARPVTLVCDLAGRTWYRFKNIHATCWIDSEVGTEEAWWGVDASVPTLGANRLAKLSPLFFGPLEFDPNFPPSSAPDSVDGNGLPVLPHLRTGWMRLGAEGVKRLRHVYVSHVTQSLPSNKTGVLQVGYRIGPFPHLDPVALGTLPANPRYKRNRLRVDARGYGIQVDVQQVLPAYVSRLYDVAVDAWPQDRGKL